MQDYRVPRKYLRELAGIPEATLRNLISNNPEIAANESGYPVFGVMRALNKALQNQEIEIDGETLDLEKNAKYEKMLKDRITNQTKMGLLIPKEAAKKRIMKAFEAVARKIKYSIKFVSPHLIGIQSKKIIEEKLINSYNDAVVLLREEAKNLTWEEDGSVKVLRSQLTKMLPQDDDFNEVYKEAVDKEW